MANDVTLFEGFSGNLPAHMQSGEVDDMTRSLAGMSDSNIKRISIKGGRFRLMIGAKEVGKKAESEMNMVIVNSASGYARTYYKDAYKEGVTVAPACWSDDGNAPSEYVESPQSKLCASCPQNVKGSGAGGGRACRYSARLAVVLENDLGGDVYGVTLPATSIFGTGNSSHSPLQEYVQKLFGHKVAANKVVTEFSFDTNSPTPKLMFRAVRPLTDEEWAVIEKQSKSADAAQYISARKYSSAGASSEAGETPAAVKAEPVAEEPKVVKKKAEPVKEGEKDVASILDEWAD
jgi:hypothetical protein